LLFLSNLAYENAKNLIPSLDAKMGEFFDVACCKKVIESGNKMGCSKED
jgi:hypothetical protein